MDPGTRYVVCFSVPWAFVMLTAVVLQVWVLYEGYMGRGNVQKPVAQPGPLDQKASAPVAVVTAD